MRLGEASSMEVVGVSTGSLTLDLALGITALYGGIVTAHETADVTARSVGINCSARITIDQLAIVNTREAAYVIRIGRAFFGINSHHRVAR